MVKGGWGGGAKEKPPIFPTRLIWLGGKLVLTSKDRRALLSNGTSVDPRAILSGTSVTFYPVCLDECCMFLQVSSGHKRPLSSYPQSLTEAHRSDTGACNRRGYPQEDCIDAQDIFIETGSSRVSVVSRREGDYLESFFAVLTMARPRGSVCITAKG